MLADLGSGNKHQKKEFAFIMSESQQQALLPVAVASRLCHGSTVSRAAVVSPPPRLRVQRRVDKGMQDTNQWVAKAIVDAREKASRQLASDFPSSSSSSQGIGGLGGVSRAGGLGRNW